jgi:hypothetical protein
MMALKQFYVGDILYPEGMSHSEFPFFHFKSVS